MVYVAPHFTLRVLVGWWIGNAWWRRIAIWVMGRALMWPTPHPNTLAGMCIMLDGLGTLSHMAEPARLRRLMVRKGMGWGRAILCSDDSYEEECCPEIFHFTHPCTV